MWFAIDSEHNVLLLFMVKVCGVGYEIYDLYPAGYCLEIAAQLLNNIAGRRSQRTLAFLKTRVSAGPLAIFIHMKKTNA